MSFVPLRKCVGICVQLTFLFIFRAVAQNIPEPTIAFDRSEHEVFAGHEIQDYFIEVVNRNEFSEDLFVRTSSLPPCGKNPNASRTWLNFYSAGGHRIYGHCVIDGTQQLASIGFGIPKGTKPPKKIYIEFVDRLTGTVVRSNTIDLPDQ